MRRGEVIHSAGFDGEYGVIRLFKDSELQTPTGVGFLFAAEYMQSTDKEVESHLPEVDEKQIQTLDTGKQAGETDEQRQIVDFDEMVVFSAELLENDAEQARRWQTRYRWISIDEYQDIDDMQYHLIRLLVGPGNGFCAIGDPDQAIYSFRGANVEFFLRFQSDFPRAKIVHLTRNYRSGKNIVSASSQMIAPTSLVEHRTLLAMLAEEGKVVIHQAATEKAEAEFVVHTIEQLIGGYSFFSRDSGRVHEYSEQS